MGINLFADEKPVNLLDSEEKNQPDEYAAPEGFLSKLPRNILIGLTHLGRNIHNAPHDVVAGLEHGTEKLGQAFNQIPGSNLMPKHKPLSESLPYDPNSYAETFGQKGEGTFMDKLLQKGIEHAPELIGARGLLRAGLSKYPITKTAAARKLKEAEKMVHKLDIPNIPINNAILYEAEKFLPKTHATSEMLNAASKGEYSPSFALQSQIGKHERDLIKSPLAAERLLAPQATELRQTILSEMEKGLRTHGYHEAADLMKGGINDYRKYMKFKNKVWPILKGLGVPATALALTAFGVKKGKELISNLTD